MINLDDVVFVEHKENDFPRQIVGMAESAKPATFVRYEYEEDGDFLAVFDGVMI